MAAGTLYPYRGLRYSLSNRANSVVLAKASQESLLAVYSPLLMELQDLDFLRKAVVGMQPQKVRP